MLVVFRNCSVLNLGRSGKVISSSVILSSRGFYIKVRNLNVIIMMLLYGYFEDYLMKLSTGRGCVPVFNSAVKLFGSFKVFFSVFCNTYVAKQKHPGCKKSARPRVYIL